MKNPVLTKEMTAATVKLKDVPIETLKIFCDRIKVLYEKAKVVAALNKLVLPEEDFWTYTPGTGFTASHAPGEEKQKGQHILICVTLIKLMKYRTN